MGSGDGQWAVGSSDGQWAVAMGSGQWAVAMGNGRGSGGFGLVHFIWFGSFFSSFIFSFLLKFPFVFFELVCWSLFKIALFVILTRPICLFLPLCHFAFVFLCTTLPLCSPKSLLSVMDEICFLSPPTFG